MRSNRAELWALFALLYKGSPDFTRLDSAALNSVIPAAPVTENATSCATGRGPGSAPWRAMELAGLNPYYLGDTSALTCITQSKVAVRLRPLLESGLVARCTPTDLEAGFSSTSPASHRAMREFRSRWPFVAMDQSVLDRAVEVQDELAARSQQQGAKIADLLIAAAAEVAGLVVLHYDRDFDLIAKITAQRTEWIVPAGTVP